MLTQPVYRVISYINGSSIFLSGVHPFSYDTHEVENLGIHVIVSLLEEFEKPDFLKETMLPYRVKHYYYSIKDSPDQILYPFYDRIFTHIFNTLERGKNILLHCRNGESLCVAFLISFFIQCVRWAEKYLICDYLNYIPKYFNKWTDSFLYYIQYVYPPTQLRHEFREQLYEYERQTLKDEEEEESE